MTCDYYRVLYEGIVIAEKMTLETALLLLEALFTKYWKEDSIHYTIEKMEEENQDG